ncbi:transcriptional regulator [Halalkalibacter sp. APA_J-10(15)]|uniref:transcriptional regulator n=1 Tax=Halalkalibacter sp. APA_J-10(15) TaxID=2933805 RepID=UPI001FF285DE|nr:transcriptional regulator [Halalkalibacter sp. APA_J-10(15)]MCK0470057.1 transcriptional regulator [Halalkalibacter sp. APA_J-10(15)]
MSNFDQALHTWLENQIAEENNHRRREFLIKGLGHGTIRFLQDIWFPTFGNFNHLYPEWEVRDFNNGYRYLDLAYRPSHQAKGAIEIQGYGPHARDLDVRRFKDLCWRHSLLALDGWTLLPIAYLSITDEPQRCQQLTLAFIGKFTSIDVSPQLSWLESEVVRFSQRTLRPLTPLEVAQHLHISDRYARIILHKLVDKQILAVASGNQRARTYVLK